MTHNSRTEKLAEIELLMAYAVPKEHLPTAVSLVQKHGDDDVALHIFHSFYSFLPEAEDDAIQSLRLLAMKKGFFIVGASTHLGDYLYLATGEDAEFLGRKEEGIWDEEVLSFFEIADRTASIAKFADFSGFPFYIPVHLNKNLCPVCNVSQGEYHILGCTLEICPWCGGQLVSCNCRFTQLELDEMENEAHLAALSEKTEEAGRIPFDPESQRPSYPLTPEDLLPPEKD